MRQLRSGWAPAFGRPVGRVISIGLLALFSIAAVGVPLSAISGGPAEAGKAASQVRRFQTFIEEENHWIRRGRWVDIKTYNTTPNRPVTHAIQLNLNIRKATGDRPSFVKVSWVRDKGDGVPDRTGSQVLAVPSFRGDRPFQVSHEHTFLGVPGKTTAQVYVQGKGKVLVTHSVVKAVSWPGW